MFLKFHFIAVKEFWHGKNFGDFLETLFDFFLFLFFFLNIIVNVNFFSDFEFEYYCKYYSEILLQVCLKQETKIDGRGHEIFSKKNYWAMKYFGLWSPGLRNFLSKICKTLRAKLPSYVLNVRSHVSLYVKVFFLTLYYRIYKIC